MAAWIVRMQQELRMLENAPPAGVEAGLMEGALNHLTARLLGPEGSAYAGGVFLVDVRIPERYPYEPPKLRLDTMVYHPNIDGNGNICLDILFKPPQGSWNPTISLGSVLASVRELLARPQADVGLMASIAQEYTHHREAFNSNARKWTDLYARPGSPEPSTSFSQSRSCHGRSPHSAGPPNSNSLTRRVSQHLNRARSMSVEVDSPALAAYKENLACKENIEPEPSPPPAMHTPPQPAHHNQRPNGAYRLSLTGEEVLSQHTARSGSPPLTRNRLRKRLRL